MSEKDTIKKDVVDKWADMSVNNNIFIAEEDKKHVSLNITGSNNNITIKKISKNNAGKIEIWLRGNNNSIFLEENISVTSKLIITMGRIHKNFGPINNSSTKIGANTTFGSTTIITYNSNASIEIGEGCMFAFNSFIYHTDAHPVIEKVTGKIVNKVYDLRIGNHVWVGGNVSILKNTKIPDDCILGLGSICSGDFYKKGNGNTGYAIAGNPAKIIKDGLTWSGDGSQGYVQNIKETYVNKSKNRYSAAFCWLLSVLNRIR